MAHRRTAKETWKRTPGGFDALNIHTANYPSRAAFGFPELCQCTLEIPPTVKLLAYTKRDDSGKEQRRAICHFFLDDYRFEPVWNRPTAGLRRVARFWAALTPDFSLYTDWPAAVQIWNTYRARWIGRYWQAHGVQAIPTVNWSDSSSFEWAFAGLPAKSVVAIGVPDVRNAKVRGLFEAGFSAMCSALSPTLILVYGSLPFDAGIPTLSFTPDWHSLRGKHGGD